MKPSSSYTLICLFLFGLMHSVAFAKLPLSVDEAGVGPSDRIWQRYERRCVNYSTSDLNSLISQKGEPAKDSIIGLNAMMLKIAWQQESRRIITARIVITDHFTTTTDFLKSDHFPYKLSNGHLLVAGPTLGWGDDYSCGRGQVLLTFFKPI